MRLHKLVRKNWLGLFRWWQGRDFRLLLQGLPALLFGAVVLTLSLVSLLTPDHEIQARYVAEAAAALKDRRYETAVTCYERLVGDFESRPDLLYGLAMALDQTGQKPRCGQIMTGLAPTRGEGYPDAHYWMANLLLSSTPRTEAMVDEAEAHLQKALEGEFSLAAHARLGQLYFVRGKLEQAELHILKCVDRLPQQRIWLARLYQKKGDTQLAHGEADRVVTYFRRKTESDPGDDFSRMAWAEATAFLEKYAETAAVLEKGLALADEPGLRTTYRKFLAQVHLGWGDSLKADGGGKLGEQLAHWEAGLNHDPDNAELINRVMNVTAVEGEGAEQARGVLIELLAAGKATATVHFALGVDAHRRGDADNAKLHWEQAYKLAPHTPVIANNLAFALSEGEGADLPRALEVATGALKLAPDAPTLLDTRAQILMKMGKWDEALVDLERLHPAVPQDPEVHRLLATVYDHLGSPRVAAEHRRQAGEKAARQKQKQSS